MAFPNAGLVDGELAMRAARRVKTPEEVTALREAIRVAEVGLAAAVAELRPGVSEKTLAGVLLEAMAAGGVSTPSTQDAAWVTARDHPWRRASDDGRVQPGDLVAFSAGVVDAGYTGEVGRTWPVGEPNGAADLYRRWDTLWHGLYDVCKPGAAGTDLLAAYDAARHLALAQPAELKRIFMAATKLPEAVVDKQLDERTDLSMSQMGEPQRQPRLADAARSAQGQRADVAEQPGEFRQVPFPADEAVRLRREIAVAHRGLDRPGPSVVVALTAFVPF